MIVEIKDITNIEGTVVGHTLDLPPDTNMRTVFDHDPNLKAIQKHVVRAFLNDLQFSGDSWLDCSPGHGDRLTLEIMPGTGLELPTLIAIVSTIVSVVRFIISLFASPASSKEKSGGRESSVYNFEGIRDTFAPGNPIPVIYGTHRVGIQMLMYYIDVDENGKGNTMALLGGVCEGEILCIRGVEVNGTLATDIGSLSVTTRLGTLGQTVIPGFERIKNTFSDGREVSTQSIIYTTKGGTIESIDLHVAAPEGLIFIKTTKKGKTRRLPNTIRYRIESRKPGEASWLDRGIFSITGATLTKLSRSVPIQFTERSQYQVRLTWLSAAVVDDLNARFRLALPNVTEYEDVSGSHSGTALIAIKGAATAQLQGGRPNITCLVDGKLVDIYDSVSSKVTGWTQNPAWCVLDYMTNSTYGMGGYLNTGDIDIQSFIDFATLSDSQARVCP